MKVWIYQENNMIERASLWEALHLEQVPHKIIAFTGAGGKTSTMYRLADELAERGKRVVVTTSTHIRRPDDRDVLITESAADVKIRLNSPGVLVVGLPASDNKLKGLSSKEGAALSCYADIVLVEADGAKCLPLKVPGDKEPVIWKEVDAVIGCAGLDCIGKPFKDVCFRLDLTETLLKVSRHDLVTPEDVACILQSGEGTRKGVGTREYRIVLNKCDSKAALGLAEAVLMRMYEKTAAWGVVTSYVK